MCVMNTPTMPDPVIPPERAAMRAPDGGAITDSASRRATDRLRGASSTVLTSGSGVSDNAATGKKTLLGG